MKKINIVLGLILMMAISAIAQDKELRDLKKFNKVKVGQAITVHLKQGSEERVEVEVKGASLEAVVTEVSADNTLTIKMNQGNFRNVSAKVYVTFTSLEGIFASSASEVHADGMIKSDRLEIKVSSAAEVDVAIDAKKLTASISSSGDLNISGKVEEMDFSTSSAGEIDAYDLSAEQVTAKCSSGSEAKVNVSKGLDAKASSGASIRYKGNPARMEVNSSSGGSVKKID